MKRIGIAALACLWCAALLAGVNGATATVNFTIAAHAAPTVALSNLGVGLVTSGAHTYKYTFVTAVGETLPSTASNSVTTVEATNGKVNLSGILAGPAGTTARKVYRVKATPTTWDLLTTINDNTTTTYVDNVADASLGAAAPSSNTTQLAAPGACTDDLAGAGAGNLSNGAYTYKVTLYHANGETTVGTVSGGVTVVDNGVNGKVALTAIPTGAAGTVGRKLYRTEAAGGTYYLLATIADNTTTIYTDNISDATLITQGAAPVANTTGIADATTAPTAALANLGAGNVTTGAHTYKIGFVTSTGVSTLSDASGSVTTATTTNGKVDVTLVASANAAVTGINVYRTQAGGSVYYLANSTPQANSNGTYVDNISDAISLALGAAPSSDTGSAAADTTLAVTAGLGFTSLMVHNQDSTNPLYVSFDGTTPTTSDFKIPGATLREFVFPEMKDRSKVTSIKIRATGGTALTAYYYTEDQR